MLTAGRPIALSTTTGALATRCRRREAQGRPRHGSQPLPEPSVLHRLTPKSHCGRNDNIAQWIAANDDEQAIH